MELLEAHLGSPITEQELSVPDTAIVTLSGWSKPLIKSSEFAPLLLKKASKQSSQLPNSRNLCWSLHRSWAGTLRIIASTTGQSGNLPFPPISGFYLQLACDRHLYISGCVSRVSDHHAYLQSTYGTPSIGAALKVDFRTLLVPLITETHNNLPFICRKISPPVLLPDIVCAIFASALIQQHLAHIATNVMPTQKLFQR